MRQTYKLPKLISCYAKDLVAANYIAWVNEEHAIETLTEMYNTMRNNPATDSVSTGGMIFTRDDDEILFWIDPRLVWRKS